MALISKIKLPDNIVYDIKDTVSGYAKSTDVVANSRIEGSITSETSTNIPTTAAIITYLNSNFGIDWKNINGEVI